MVNFKIGDVVRVLGKPETLRTIVGVPLKYATLPWATSPSRVWLDNGGWIYITELELVDVDDPLPPAPESVRYNEGTVGFPFEVKSLLGNNLFPHRIRLGVLCGDRDITHKYVCVDPDTALQLAHDLRRMAMEIKRKERNG